MEPLCSLLCFCRKIFQRGPAVPRFSHELMEAAVVAGRWLRPFCSLRRCTCMVYRACPYASCRKVSFGANASLSGLKQLTYFHVQMDFPSRFRVAARSGFGIALMRRPRDGIVNLEVLDRNHHDGCLARILPTLIQARESALFVLTRWTDNAQRFFDKLSSTAQTRGGLHRSQLAPGLRDVGGRNLTATEYWCCLLCEASVESA